MTLADQGQITGTGRVVTAHGDRGAGFALSPRSVVTAGHVIRGSQAENIVFIPDNGDSAVAVSGVHHDELHDIATLDLLADVQTSLRAVRPKVGQRWVAQTVGREIDTVLTGTVSATNARVEKRQGHPVRALQLEVGQHVGDYSGYSGSAVRLLAQRNAVIGVLIEQVERRDRGTQPAANVLLAMPLKASRRLRWLLGAVASIVAIAAIATATWLASPVKLQSEALPSGLPTSPSLPPVPTPSDSSVPTPSGSPVPTPSGSRIPTPSRQDQVLVLTPSSGMEPQRALFVAPTFLDSNTYKGDLLFFCTTGKGSKAPNCARDEVWSYWLRTLGTALVAVAPGEAFESPSACPPPSSFMQVVNPDLVNVPQGAVVCAKVPERSDEITVIRIKLLSTSGTPSVTLEILDWRLR